MAGGDCDGESEAHLLGQRPGAEGAERAHPGPEGIKPRRRTGEDDADRRRPRRDADQADRLEDHGAQEILGQAGGDFQKLGHGRAIVL